MILLVLMTKVSFSKKTGRKCLWQIQFLNSNVILKSRSDNLSDNLHHFPKGLMCTVNLLFSNLLFKLIKIVSLFKILTKKKNFQATKMGFLPLTLSL